MAKAVGQVLSIVGTVVSYFAPYIGAILVVVGAALSYVGAQDEARKAARRAAALRQKTSAITGNIASGDENHLLVFGETRVGGVYLNVGTTGTDNEYLHVLVAHGITHPGGIEGITGLWLNDKPVAMSFAATATSNAGTATETRTIAGAAGLGDQSGYVTTKTFLGLGTQDADVGLVATGLFDASSRARGVAYTWFQFLFPVNNATAFNKAFPNGFPQATVLLKGLKLYDVRKDSTRGGSGTHRADNALTWEYSRNSALATATYLVMSRLDGGCDVSPDAVNWASVAASANLCDTNLVFTGKPRFTCNLVLETSNDCLSNLDLLADSMAGQVYEQGGIWQVRAAGYDAPTAVITDTWLADGITLSVGAGLGSLYNAVRVRYASKIDLYQLAEAQPIINAAYEAQDGGERLFRDLTIQGCDDPLHAQYIGMIESGRSRMQRKLALTTKLHGLTLDIWQTVQVNISPLPELTNVVWRIESRRIAEKDGALVCRFSLVEESAAVYAEGSYTAEPTRPGQGFARPTPRAPQNMSATAVADGINLRWQSVSNVQGYPVEIEVSTTPEANPPFVYTLLARVYGETFQHGVTDGQPRRYRIRCVSDYGDYSSYASVSLFTPKTVDDGATRNTNTENILQNGTPSEGTAGQQASGWATGVTIQQDTSSDGTANALVLRSGPHSGFGGPASRDFAFASGESYIISGYYKTGGTGNWLMFYFEDGSNANLAMPGTAPTVWTAFSFNYTVPAGRKSGRLKIANASATADTITLEKVSIRKVRNLDTEVADGQTRVARTVYGLPSAQSAAQWAKIGTWHSGGQGQTLRLQVESGVGFNSNTRQQSTTSILVRTANDNSAPNLSGITWLTEGRDAITGVKAVAAGGSTSPTNRSWDIYLQLATFAAGHYTPYLAVQGGGSWVHAIAANQPDPGAASGTVVVGQGNQTFDENSTLDFARNILTNRNADFLAESATRRWAGETGATVGARLGSNFRTGGGALINDLDQFPDGLNYARPLASRLASGRPFINLAESENLNRTLDYVAETATRRHAGETGANITETRTSLDTSNVGGRTSGTVRDESRNGHELTVAGSNRRVGDQRNIGALTIANQRSKWVGQSIATSFDSASPAIVTISVSAATLKAGVDIPYAASSGSVSQARSSTVTYFFYFDDQLAGGTQTLIITTNGDNGYANGRTYVGFATVTIPGSGTGTGSGGSGGGGGGTGGNPQP